MMSISGDVKSDRSPTFGTVTSNTQDGGELPITDSPSIGSAERLNSRRSSTSGSTTGDSALTMPILRIWGHFQAVWKHQWPLWKLDDLDRGERKKLELEFEVSLEDHDRRNAQVDLSDPDWYKDLAGLDDDDLQVDRQLASQHFELRSDRFSKHDGWTPYQSTVHYEVADDDWVAIRLVLADRARPKGSRLLYPSQKQLLECVHEYLQRWDSEKRETCKRLPLLDPPQIKAISLPRGRKRRSERRRARANPKGSPGDLSVSITQAISNTLSSDRAQLRGRLRKRHRRGAAFGRPLTEPASNAEDSPDTRLSYMHEFHSIPATSTVAQSNLPEHLRSASQLLVAEWDSSQIYEDSDVKSYEHNGNIAVPITTNDGSKILSCLFIPKKALKKSYGESEPWHTCISDAFGHRVEVEKIGISETSEQYLAIPREYWEKFPVRASELFKNELRRVQNNNAHVLYSLQWSFTSPMLLSPDMTQGPLADKDEYSLNSFLISPKEFVSNGIEGNNTYETFRWLSDAGDVWHNKRTAWALIQLHDVEDVVLGEPLTTTADKPPDLPTERMINPSSLARSQEYFTRAVALMERDGLGDGFKSISTSSTGYDSSSTIDELELLEHESETHDTDIKDRDKVESSPALVGGLGHETASEKSDSLSLQGDPAAFDGQIREVDNLRTNAERINDESPDESVHQPAKTSEKEIDSREAVSLSTSEASHGALLYSDSLTHSEPPSPVMSGVIYLRESDLSDHDPDRYSIDDVEGKLDEIYINTTYPRDIFYGAGFLTLVPLWDQENHARIVKELAFDPKHHPDVRAHAALQYALCLLSEFGVIGDHDQGLEWFYSAAKAGSRRGRAVVRLLFRAYGRILPDYGESLEWLIEEAKSGSQWALEELRRENPTTYVEVLKEKTYWWSGPGKEAIDLLQALNLKDGQALEMQLESIEQAEQTAAKSKVKSSAKIDDSFYEVTSFWACISSKLEIFSVLFLRSWKFADTDRIDHDEMSHNCLLTALEASRADTAHWILDWKLSRKEPYHNHDLNVLFFLLQIPHQEVQSIVQKLVELGEDVNEQIDVQENHWDSDTFCYAFRPRGGWNMGEHWKRQGKGFSMTPLRWAMINHNAALVKVLLASGATFPRAPDANSYKDLHTEAFGAELSTVAILDVPCYDIDILRMFLDIHGKQPTQTVFAETPLGLIASEPDSPERRLRLGKLATPEYLFPVLTLLRKHQQASDPELFRAAVMNGHSDIVEYLVTSGVDIESRCSGLTPLHTAILYGKKSIFTYLLKHGANASALTTKKGISSIHLIFWKPKLVALEMFMLSELSLAGAVALGFNCPFAKKVNPLHLAVMGSRVEAVRKLIELGMDRFAVLDDELMPFIEGARQTEWGINRSKEVQSNYVGMEYYGRVAIPIKGCTPVGIILQRWDMFLPEDFLKLLKLLCTKGNDFNDFYTKPDIKQTILHLVVCHPVLMRAGILEYILEEGRSAGLHINIQDVNGDTPLHYASLLRGSTQGGVIAKLVDMGADSNVRNDYGMTPSDIRFWGHLYGLSSKEEFPKKTLQFKTTHGQYSNKDRALRGRQGDKGRSGRDGLLSASWASLCDGVTFRHAWDLDTGADFEFDQDLIVRILVGEGDRERGSYVDE